MQIQENIDLKPFNTFGVSAKAKYFLEINTESDLIEVLTDKRFENIDKLPIGGGSNILLTQDFDGLVLKMNLTGIELIRETEKHFFISVGAGEVWHDFVLHAIDCNWAGIENLSLIPGNVGAAPMQNIGAYGVEVDQVLDMVRFYNTATNAFEELTAEQCQLGYRTSIFKTELKGKSYITKVFFRLNKEPNLNTSYGAIEAELKAMGIDQPTIKEISQAVINIRSSKLPDPRKIGNAGSFFKNPVISSSEARKLIDKYDAPHYQVGEDQIKIPAGWLIEQAGWKGRLFDNSFGVHDKQALVLINKKGATGRQVYDLSQNILEDVQSKFGILLEREVNIL